MPANHDKENALACKKRGPIRKEMQPVIRTTAVDMLTNYTRPNSDQLDRSNKSIFSLVIFSRPVLTAKGILVIPARVSSADS